MKQETAAAELAVPRVIAAGERRRPALADPALRWALRGACATFLITTLAGIAAWLLIGPVAIHGGFDPSGYVDRMGTVRDTLAAPYARWDSVWYIVIARYGYAPGPSTAFFPLYMLLTHVVALAGPGQLIAGVIVSLVSLVIALRGLWLLTEIELGADAARLAVLCCALFPMAFFFSAVYSESLYLAVSVWAFLMARRGRWAWAGALGALAAATRSAGVLVAVGLLVLLIADENAGLRDALWLALVPLGLLAYMGWLAILGIDPMSPFNAQEVWYRHFAGPFGGIWDGARAAWGGVRQLVSGSTRHDYFPQAGGNLIADADHNVLLFASLLAVVPAVVGVLRRLPLAYGAYVIAALALPLSYPVTPQPLMSLPRFIAVLFPLYMWGGWWLARHPRLRVPLLGASATAMAIGAAEFATWHWVA
jgi:hypothetical protein